MHQASHSSGLAINPQTTIIVITHQKQNRRISRRNELQFLPSPIHIQSIMDMQILSRTIIQARDDKTFWEKYKWLIIGGAIAMPVQLIGLFF